MIDIVNKEECTGCSACANICPKKCISMKVDNEGFLYPQVDVEVCVACGLCEKICPVIMAEFESRNSYPDAYLGYVKNEKDRENSAAGGGFYAIAEMFIKKYDGIVFGAVYDIDYSVYHSYTEDITGLHKMQKSKYVQSDPRESFTEAKKFLKEGKSVLYSGTPCQIYGLKSFLKNENTDKLYCIDLSCHGVPSPKLLKEYLEYQKDKHNSEIIDFRMRDKWLLKGAYAQGFGIDFESGEHYFESHKKDLFGRCFWGEISSRPSCYECPFKTVWRISDITMGDCWFFDRFVKQENDTLGVTMMLVQSEKGHELLNECSSLVYYDVDAEELIKTNGGMIFSSAVKHPARDNFFNGLGKIPFEEHVKSFFPDRQESYKEKLKHVLFYKGIRLEPFRKLSRMIRSTKRIKSSSVPQNAKGIKKV